MSKKEKLAMGVGATAVALAAVAYVLLSQGATPAKLPKRFCAGSSSG